MQGRVKCPSCESSTIPIDGCCEFCGAVVNRATADAARERQARNEPPAAPENPWRPVILIGGILGVLLMLAVGVSIVRELILRAQIRRMHAEMEERAADLEALGIERDPGSDAWAASLRRSLHWLVRDAELRARRDALLERVDAAVTAGTADEAALFKASQEASRVAKDNLVDGDEAERVFRLIEAAL